MDALFAFALVFALPVGAFIACFALYVLYVAVRIYASWCVFIDKKCYHRAR